MHLKEIGYIKTDFPEKFGIPRQSGLLEGLEAEIHFFPEYRNPDAFNGLEEFSHLWILWQFDVPEKKGWSATVKPPRLGGNTPMGVFSTRSPFRPNPIGLSSVRLNSIEFSDSGPILHVTGADMRDGSIIYDIKPYLKYTDSHVDAVDGFAARYMDNELEVDFPLELLEIFPEGKRRAAVDILRSDPRPHYQNDPERTYGVAFCGFDIHFKVSENTAHVVEVVPYHKKSNKISKRC